MTDSRGNVLRLVRDRQRTLREIVTSSGRRITLSHDDQARVIRAQDDENHTVEYRDSSDGMLVRARRSDGRARDYTYDGTLLTAV